MILKIVIGVDFGSDSVRAVAVDALSGDILASACRPYRMWAEGKYCNPRENRYRQHPADHIEALSECLREVADKTDAGSIYGISFDTTASTPVITEINGLPLALTEGFEEDPDAMFILWKDHTAVAEAERINEVAHEWEKDYTISCGGSYSCEWTWAKVLHILRTNPKVRDAAYSWTEHCDWISGMLTGNLKPETMVRSRCTAGHKALWSKEWGGLPSEEFLHEVDPLLDIFRGHLYTETATADKAAGVLTEEWAEKTGLPAGILVGTGAIDCHFGAVGAGITEGSLIKVIGTSTCDIAVTSPENIKGKTIRGICGQVEGSVLPEHIGLEAGQSAFGDVYAWWKRTLGWSLSLADLSPEGRAEAEKRIMERLTEEAAALPLTADDITATDWFNGRRTPDLDPLASADISGLTLASTPAMIYKALVEATAYGSRAITERFIKEGVKIEKIVAVGGISKKSPYVMQTMADVIGMPISVLNGDQACALGAAMYASVISGIHSDISVAQKAMFPGYSRTYVPDGKRHEIYNHLYANYQNRRTDENN